MTNLVKYSAARTALAEAQKKELAVSQLPNDWKGGEK